MSYIPILFVLHYALRLISILIFLFLIFNTYLFLGFLPLCAGFNFAECIRFIVYFICMFIRLFVSRDESYRGS